MKKTKTGLHIQARKNRIEVYTQQELEAKNIKREKQRVIVLQLCLFFAFFMCAVLGYLIGCSK
tara:strand:- start:7079 stop:7267 length:189 start_codon:yes stop_codon:yes gene_type:complete